MLLLEEGIEVSEQVSVTSIAHTATLLRRQHYVNVSDFRHYFPFGPRGSVPSGRQTFRARTFLPLLVTVA